VALPTPPDPSSWDVDIRATGPPRDDSPPEPINPKPVSVVAQTHRTWTSEPMKRRRLLIG
jgi:hypothetical protein